MNSPLLYAYKQGTKEYNIASECYEYGYEKGRAEAFEEAIEYFEEHAKEVYNHISARDFICDRLEMLKEQK